MKNKYIFSALILGGLAFVLYLIWKKNEEEKTAGTKEDPKETPQTNGGAFNTTPTSTGGGAAPSINKDKELFIRVNAPKEVQALQKALNNLNVNGGNLAVDGNLGSATEAAIIIFTGANKTTLQTIEVLAGGADYQYLLDPNSLYE